LVNKHDTAGTGEAGARKLDEEAFAVRRRVLGSHHSYTFVSAWNLTNTLKVPGDREEVQAVLQRDLLWLLRCDRAKLSGDRRKIRVPFLTQPSNRG
jgi:hypothetical protein